MAPDRTDARPSRPARPARPRWRYLLVVGLICFAVVAAAAAGWRYGWTSGPAFGPVVVISIDSLRADHLPAYGYAKVQTPAIDALAADSVTFDRAFAHSPQTLPSHVAILSGRLPFETGVRDNFGFVLPPSLLLLPQLLHRRGFKTGGVVSSYLLRKDTGLGQAFGFFDDGLEKGPGLERDGAEAVRVAENWIDSIRTARFFLFVQLNEPAAPYAPPARFSRFSPYDGEIARADELVGQLVAFLKRRGLYDGAVLVLLSDHGEGLGDHGEREHGLLLYDDVLRTPLIVKLPRQSEGGQRANALVQHIDLTPTILDLMGAPRASGLRGRSLRDVLESPDSTLADRRIYAESFAGRFRFGFSELTSLMDGKHRFIKAPRPELYDLAQDPKERRNVVETDAQAAQALGSALDRLTAGVTLQPPAPVSPEERDRLASLGYVTSTGGVPADTPGAQLPDPGDEVATVEKMHEAVRLAAGGQVDGAVAKYREVVAADPSLAAGWEQLGALLVSAGRFKEAGETLAQLTSLYQKADREADAEKVVQDLVSSQTGQPSADRYALAIRLWTTMGAKARAADLRAEARKSVGDAALRQAEKRARD